MNYPMDHVVQLLYFDNLEHLESGQNQTRQKVKEGKVCDEIIFQSLVKVQLIRIVKPGYNVHQNLKKLITITQSEEPIRNLEIFAKSYQSNKPQSRYQLLFGSPEISSNNCDILITLEQPYITDFIVFRGQYKRLTICMYGEIMSGHSIQSYNPSYGKNIGLQELNDVIDTRIQRVRTITQPVDNKIYQQINKQRNEVLDHIYNQENYHLCVDNIQPQLLLEDKQFNQQESQKQIEILAKELKSIDQDYDFVDKQLVSLYHEKLEQMHRVLTKHLKHSKADIHSAAHFNDVDRIYKLLPTSLVDSVIFAIHASYSSAIRAFPIIIQLLSSKYHALLFLDKGGLNKLLEFLIEIQSSPSYFKLKVIETLYNCMNHVEFCNELITRNVEIKTQDSEKSPKKKKKVKKDKEKKKKENKEGKKKKNKKKSRSRSRSKSKSITQEQQQFTNEQVSNFNGFQLLAYTASKSEDEKIVQACHVALNRLQIYVRFRKLKNMIDLVYQGKLAFNEDGTMDFLLNNLPYQWEFENLVGLDLFLFAVQKDFYCDKQRELMYCLFDAEKTKTANFKLVKEILQMKDLCITYANAMWFRQMQFMKYIAAMMVLNQNYSQCCQLIYRILQIKGGIVVICQETTALKLIIRVLTKNNDIQLLNLIKSSLVLINLMDQIYIKLLGSDYDYELISLLGQLQQYTEEQDEITQNCAAVTHLMNNEFFSEALLYIMSVTKLDDIIEHEVEITIMSHIFINILRYNDTHIGLFLADRLIAPNARFIKYINTEKSRFSADFRLSQILLAGVLEPYELFLAKDTTKAIRESFHQKLKFVAINQDPDKNKLKEYFGVGEHKKGIHEELKSEFRLLGTFDQPYQSLQFLDGAIKIFKWLCNCNKFYFIPFFEHEVIAGVECFAGKLINLFSAMTSKNIQTEYMLIKLPNQQQILRHYFDLTYNTIELIQERLKFRVQLGCESSFHSNDLCKILIDLWVSLQKVQPNGLRGCKQKVENLLNILRNCFNYVITLNSFQDEDNDQLKLHAQQGSQEIQTLFQSLYLSAFRNQEEQKYILNLMQYLIKDNQNKPQFSNNLFNVLFKPMRKNDDEFENYTKNGDLGFLIDTMGDQKCLQNLMQSSLRTFDTALQNEMFKVLRNLLELYDHNISQHLFKIIEDQLKNYSNKIKALAKKEDQQLYLKYRQDWVLLGLFLTQAIDICLCNCGFMYIFNYEHLNEDMIKIYKLIDAENDYCDSQPTEKSYKLLIATLRNQILQIFKKAVDHECGVSQFLQSESQSYQYLIEDIPHITYLQDLLKSLAKNLVKHIEYSEDSKEYYHLNLISSKLIIEILECTSKNIVGQNILLYSDYTQSPYKAKPIFQLYTIVELVQQSILNYNNLPFQSVYTSIIEQFISLLFRLFVSIPNNVIHPGDVRKRAIQTLMFNKQENILDFITNLSNYLSNIPQFIKHVKLLQFLLKQIESNNKEIKDQNVTLPSEPRTHLVVFQLIQEKIQQLQSKGKQQQILSSFFKQTVLEGDKMLKYQSLTVSEVTPWKLAFKELKKESSTQSNTFIFPEVLYKDQIFKLVPLEIPSYPKTIINDIMSLQIRQPLISKDRVGFAKISSVQPALEPIRPAVPIPIRTPTVDAPPPLYKPEMMFPLQQPNVQPHQNPINSTPVIPIRPQNASSNYNLLDSIAPPVTFHQQEDPRLQRRQDYNMHPMQQIQQQSGIQQQQQQQLQQQQALQQPIHQPYQISQIPMFMPQIPNQMGSQLPNQMAPPIQQVQPPQIPQQIPPQQPILQQPMMHMHPQHPIQQPPIQQQQPQQPQQQQQQQQQPNELAELIAMMNEQEKAILREFLTSRDPRKLEQLEQKRIEYPRIDQFLMALQQQQKKKSQ
ncbi:unnamed protein product [Paramecium primaurelia]|uniref:Uncharacterized protein n=1 Tax=Paramecium primaurelia TaxID=5886 RepID=A0A8S1Q8Z9_PARPR|nr:unnamed protein product [Paramecium primaurelia]